MPRTAYFTEKQPAKKCKRLPRRASSQPREGGTQQLAWLRRQAHPLAATIPFASHDAQLREHRYEAAPRTATSGAEG